MQRIRELAAIAALLTAAPSFAADAPYCRGTTGVRALVCADPELADEERDLAAAITRIERQSAAAVPELDAAQKTWTAAREACLSDTEPWACIRDRNLRRMAELDARYRLVEPLGEDRFACDPAGKDIVTITYFSTGLPLDVAIARRGQAQAFLFRAGSASGARYVGPGVQVWAHQGDARVRWGADAREMECRAVE